MWRIALIVAGLAAVLAACGGDDDKTGDAGDPSAREQALRQTAEKAFAAFRDGDADDFYSYFSDGFHDRCDIKDFRRLMGIASAFLSMIEDGEFEIENVRFEGDRAYLEAKFVSDGDDALNSDGEGVFLDFWVLEDGEWKTDVEDEKPCDLDSVFDDDGGSGDEKTPAPTGPGTSRDEAVALGETVRAGDLEVTVLDADLDAAEAVRAQNEFNDPPRPGNRFVLVRVRVRHVGDGEETIQASTSDVKLTGSRNVLYDNFGDASCGAFLEGELRGEMFPGGTLDGLVCFQIPRDETDLILVAQPFFSFEAGDRRFLALE
jgi:hypothetical protein